MVALMTLRLCLMLSDEVKPVVNPFIIMYNDIRHDDVNVSDALTIVIKVCFTKQSLIGNVFIIDRFCYIFYVKN